jgi:DNA-3-methyladenine glycosylase
MGRRLQFPGPEERRRILKGLSRPPEQAAPFLLGHLLVRRQGRVLRAARIVETEAYLGGSDPAAHAFRGRTRRTEPLWGPAGTVYVYFIYGVHHCLNIAVEKAGRPGCVLIRAAEMEGPAPKRAGTGPGRLCRTLEIDAALSGRHLFERGSTLYLREGRPPDRIGVSPRIGITRAAERELRFFDLSSPAVTPFPVRAGILGRRRGGGRLDLL